MFQYLPAIKKSGRQVPEDMKTGSVPVPVGADVAPRLEGYLLANPGAMFSALCDFKLEAWLGVCPMLKPGFVLAAPMQTWPLDPVR